MQRDNLLLKKRNIIDGLSDLGIDTKSLSSFLQNSIEAQEAINDAVGGVTPASLKQINEAKVLMYILFQHNESRF